MRKGAFCNLKSAAVRAHRHVRDVHVLALHLHEAEVLLGLHLAGRRELRDGVRGRRLGGLPARVGVHLGVHDEDFDFLASGENAVKFATRIIRTIFFAHLSKLSLPRASSRNDMHAFHSSFLHTWLLYPRRHF